MYKFKYIFTWDILLNYYSIETSFSRLKNVVNRCQNYFFSNNDANNEIRSNAELKTLQ